MALADLATDDGSFIFNTPNRQSGAGYRKMGWSDANHAGCRVIGLQKRRLWEFLRNQPEPALPTELSGYGRPAAELTTSDWCEVADAMKSSQVRWATNWTESVLAWRFGGQGVGYRVLWLDQGQVPFVYRVRRRGSFRELSILLFPSIHYAKQRILIRDMLKQSGADYAVVAGRWPILMGQLANRLGPTVLVRGLGEAVQVGSDPKIPKLLFSVADLDEF
jgi:hypothetical protein